MQYNQHRFTISKLRQRFRCNAKKTFSRMMHCIFTTVFAPQCLLLMSRSDHNRSREGVGWEAVMLCLLLAMYTRGDASPLVLFAKSKHNLWWEDAMHLLRWVCCQRRGAITTTIGHLWYVLYLIAYYIFLLHQASL